MSRSFKASAPMCVVPLTQINQQKVLVDFVFTWKLSERIQPHKALDLVRLTIFKRMNDFVVIDLAYVKDHIMTR